MISGWAVDPNAIYRYQVDAAFPLSDHADYTDLLRYVELVQPQRVLTLHGFAAEFARDLRERGVEAWALSEENQLELARLGSARALACRGGARAASQDEVREGERLGAQRYTIRIRTRSRTSAKRSPPRRPSSKKSGCSRNICERWSRRSLPIATVYFTGKPFRKAICAPSRWAGPSFIAR